MVYLRERREGRREGRKKKRRKRREMGRRGEREMRETEKLVTPNTLRSAASLSS